MEKEEKESEQMATDESRNSDLCPAKKKESAFKKH